jgi:hypothetical protein
MTTNTDLLTGLGNPQSDPLAELVGEGKKFKDAAALAAAKLESDRFIEQLKTENATMRSDLEKASKAGDSVAVQALIERIEKATAAKPGTESAGSLSREDIEKLVKDGMQAEQGKATREANKATSNAALLNYFNGDAAAAKAYLEKRVVTLDMSGNALNEIASSNPKMFRELFIPQAKPSGSGLNLPAGKQGSLPEATGERGKSYYDGLKKTLGKKFWSPEIQQNYFRDYKALGARFNTI